MGEPLYQDNTGPGDFSHAEPSRQESFKMRIILLLTVFTTLGFCQRQSPPSTPLTEPPQGHRCAGRNFNGRRCCTPESPVATARVIVMVLWMEELMTVTGAARETWCVAATTARSSEHTSTRRMTAATFQRLWPSLSLFLL